jgi:hypothetical protein
MKIKVLKMHGVAIWKYDIDEDVRNSQFTKIIYGL